VRPTWPSKCQRIFAFCPLPPVPFHPAHHEQTGPPFSRRHNPIRRGPKTIAFQPKTAFFSVILPIQPISRLISQPISWLSPGRLALGKLAILDGDPGLGKSLVTLDLCARLSTGRPFCTPAEDSVGSGDARRALVAGSGDAGRPAPSAGRGGKLARAQ
jgi:hypothetical protein